MSKNSKEIQKEMAEMLFLPEDASWYQIRIALGLPQNASKSETSIAYHQHKKQLDRNSKVNMPSVEEIELDCGLPLISWYDQIRIKRAVELKLRPDSTWKKILKVSEKLKQEKALCKNEHQRMEWAKSCGLPKTSSSQEIARLRDSLNRQSFAKAYGMKADSTWEEINAHTLGRDKTKFFQIILKKIFSLF